MFRYCLILTLFATSFTVNAQSNCKCCASEYRQFDFWIGDWEVYDTLNNLVGTNVIEVKEDSCLITERWIGSKVTTGVSMNYYKASDNSWNQVWVDNQGTNLNLKGRKVRNKMVLRSNLIPGKKIDY